MKKRKKNNNRSRFIICISLFALIVVCLALVKNYDIGGIVPASATEPPTEASEPSEIPTEISGKHIIENFKVLNQDVLLAGCEVYASTETLQYYGYDIDEFTVAEQYLITYPISYDEYSTRYGPDMRSAQAGDVYTGYGIYAPALAKSLNSYLETTGASRRAHPIDGQSLDSLCEQYVANDIPVIMWATVDMGDPGHTVSWVVSYVDENATHQIGDTFDWYFYEHCIVLVGYDEDEYYFADSIAGEITHYEKALCRERYEQIGSMAMVID